MQARMRKQPHLGPHDGRSLVSIRMFIFFGIDQWYSVMATFFLQPIRFYVRVLELFSYFLVISLNPLNNSCHCCSLHCRTHSAALSAREILRGAGRSGVTLLTVFSQAQNEVLEGLRTPNKADVSYATSCDGICRANHVSSLERVACWLADDASSGDFVSTFIFRVVKHSTSKA